QKQRTAIARAVLRDPALLIMDDAMSAVDTFTEERILSRLRGFGTLGQTGSSSNESEPVRTRTSIIVSHRISTVREADLILVLDAGRIAERGTHASLVAEGGIYAAMHTRQLLEQELEAS